MIWACMTWTGLVVMALVDGKLNVESYCKLLESALPGSIMKWKNIQGIPPQNGMLFMQDNTSCHCATTTEEHLQDV